MAPDPPAAIRVEACPADITIDIDHRPSLPPDSAALTSHWAALQRSNPRLHDGPILAVTSIDPAAAHDHSECNTRSGHSLSIHARVDAYRRLAVQPRVTTGVRLLGVTLVLVSHHQGPPAFLLARRGPSVRCYPNAWELGPSGGVSVPPATITRLTTIDLARAALDELDEELGISTTPLEGTSSITPDPSTLTPRVLLHDDAAHSLDVVLAPTAAVPGGFADAATTNWEYTDYLWVPCATAADWAAELTAANPANPDAHPDAVAPPTRALLAHWRELMPGV